MFASHAVQLNLSGGGGTRWSQPPASCTLLAFSVYEVIRVACLCVVGYQLPDRQATWMTS